jgi:hypothetical protein
LPPRSSQHKEKPPATPHWDPPHVEAPLTTLSAVPRCEAGWTERRGVVNHLQNFIAHEQIRYEQTDRQGRHELSLAAKFDDLVDFGNQSNPLKVHEIGTTRGATDSRHLRAILDKGLPVLALIFCPGF